MTVRNATFDELDAVKKQLITLQSNVSAIVTRLNVVFASAHQADERLKATIVSVNNATRRAEAVDIRALRRLEAFDFDKANEAAVTVAKLKLDVEKLAANVAKLRR